MPPDILDDEADEADEAGSASAASFTAADFAVFDEALGCLMDEACAAFAQALKIANPVAAALSSAAAAL